MEIILKYGLDPGAGPVGLVALIGIGIVGTSRSLLAYCIYKLFCINISFRFIDETVAIIINWPIFSSNERCLSNGTWPITALTKKNPDEKIHMIL